MRWATSGGARFPWSSAPILGLFAFSAALWVVFATRLLWAAEPFLPLSIFANQVVRMGTLAAACNVGTMIGLTIFVPLYFESVLGLSSSLSGLFLIPLMVVSNFGSIIAGRGLAAFHHYKRVPMLGLCISIASLALLAWHPYQPLQIVVLHLAAVGIGIGTVYPVCTVAVQNAVPRHQLGIATGTMNFFRALLSAIIGTLLGAIVLGGINLRSGGGLSVETLRASAGGAGLALLFRWVFVVAAGFLAASLFCIIRMEERSLPGRADIAAAASSGASVSAE